MRQRSSPNWAETKGLAAKAVERGRVIDAGRHRAFNPLNERDRQTGQAEIT